jgi:hypothetical protein
MTLEQFFQRAIAERAGIDPSQVTPEYVKKAREELYAQQTHRFTQTPGNLRVMNATERRALAVNAAAFLGEPTNEYA